jgi:hypothetical protein
MLDVVVRAWQGHQLWMIMSLLKAILLGLTSANGNIMDIPSCKSFFAPLNGLVMDMVSVVWRNTCDTQMLLMRSHKLFSARRMLNGDPTNSCQACFAVCSSFNKNNTCFLNVCVISDEKLGNDNFA